MEFFIRIALLFALVAVTRFITIIIHEMGHAIAGLILFKGEIHVYIGSYGNSDGTINFKIGRLKITFKYKIHYWNDGLCVAQNASKSLLKLYIFTLCGPLASLIVAIISLVVLLFFDFHGAIKFGAMILFVSSSIDFILNIFPKGEPIILTNGKITYNDGQTLRLYREFKGSYNEILKLSQLYQNNNIEEGFKLFSSIANPEKNKHLAQVGSAYLIKLGENQKAIDLLDKSKSYNKKWNSDDYCNYALAHSHLKQYDKSLDLHDKSLKLNPNNLYSLNNKAYTNTIIGKYEEAIEDSNKAIKLNPKFAYSYNNRGLAKIKLGNKEEGLIDINKSLELDNKNSFAYKNLGIYYLEIGNLELATENFNKAKDIDPKTDGLEDLIIKTIENTIN